MAQVDHHHTRKYHRRKQPYFFGERSSKAHQDNQGGNDGKLPGCRDDPPGRMIGTEAQERVKSAKSDTSRNDPELPVL